MADSSKAEHPEGTVDAKENTADAEQALFLEEEIEKGGVSWLGASAIPSLCRALTTPPAYRRFAKTIRGSILLPLFVGAFALVCGSQVVSTYW